MPALKPPARPTVRVAPAASPADWEAGRRLIVEMTGWLAEALDLDVRAQQHDSNDELDCLEDFYAQPNGVLLIGYVGEAACGTTGVHRIDDGTAELRRVWVTPGARGNALAPQLVAAGIEAAGAMGAHRVWLETASDVMEKAIGIYASFGFRPIPHYTSLPETVPNILSLGLDLG